MTYYYSPPPPPLPPRQQHNPVDTVLTWLLSAAFVVVAGLGFVWSLFAGMITDRCSGAVPECSDTLIAVAYLVAWGGIALAGVVTYKGVRNSVARHRVAFIWPCVGLMIVVAGLVCGGMLLNSAVGL
jgi:uncharacterized membrane protein YidH (DUF202 family)